MAKRWNDGKPKDPVEADQELIDKVCDQIDTDLGSRDFTAIDEMLAQLMEKYPDSKTIMQGFLRE